MLDFSPFVFYLFVFRLNLNEAYYSE